MLTENDVIEAVCEHLKATGYEIASRATTREHGIDIIANRTGISGRLLIEAKGETSSKSNTNRYGSPFKSGAVRVHVAEALYSAACLHATHHRSGDSIGIAFPETPRHRDLVSRIKPILDSLGVATFFVQRDHSVKTS